jgi:hypothetical protein
MSPARRRDKSSSGSVDPASVRYSEKLGDWIVRANCNECGGYELSLQVGDPAQAELARARSTAFLTRVHEAGCLGCHAHAWRTRPAPPSDQPHVWWDTDSGEWMAWKSLPGTETGVSIPLGIKTFWAPQEVRAAARALWSSERMPLRVASDRSDVEVEDTAIFYDVSSGRWHLHVACFDCDGFELRLTSFGRGAVEAACDEALACLELVAKEGCPNCRAVRERTAVKGDDDEPRIWYDTEARDWLVWQGIEGADGGVTLPLGIGRFDTRRTVVYRAAAGLLFDSEMFLDEGA